MISKTLSDFSSFRMRSSLFKSTLRTRPSRVLEATMFESRVDFHLVELSLPSQAAVVEASAGVQLSDCSHD
jgi:hypothetical protein